MRMITLNTRSLTEG